MITEFLIILAMTILGFIIVPAVTWLAKTYNFMDKPNYRKVHVKDVPRLGGIAIFVPFTAGLFLLRGLTQVFEGKTELFLALLLGGVIIAIIGLLDDKFEISPKQKLFGQLVASIVVVALGVRIGYVSTFNGEGLLALGWLVIPATIVWIIIITNAINLIDGLDGLAGGISMIAALSIAVIAFLSGNETVGLLAILLAASVVGFLCFNFYPAKIFMGDVGSLYLGFILAVITLQELKQITLFGVMVPLLLLAIPILDTLYAIVRRKVNRLPLLQPDKNHIHHALIRNGLSHRKAVLAIYGISASFAFLGIMIPYLGIGVIILWTMALMALFQLVAVSTGMLKNR